MDDTGRMIAGRYECLEKIGRGASARVYRALDRNTHQLLALKILAGGNGGDQSQQKQFRRELEALKKLKSPYTVRLVDAGSDHDDLYLAMEYVSGQSLQEVLQSQAPLDPQRACRLLIQLLKALEEAHHKGIIHRDLKPANMLIQIEGSGEHMRLADFGIARMIGMTTFHGTGSGTPCYMSPEQIEGKEVGCESDLYAVGVVMYEMLVGRPPFEGDMNTVMAAHVRRAPAWPSQPKVPKRLRQVIEMAMHKKPGSRYRSAQAMREAIESWLHGASLPMKYREDSRAWWITGMLFFGALALFANIDGTLNFFGNAKKWWEVRGKQKPTPKRLSSTKTHKRASVSVPSRIDKATRAGKPGQTSNTRGMQLKGTGPQVAWGKLLPDIRRQPPSVRPTTPLTAPPKPGEARKIAGFANSQRRWIPAGRYIRGAAPDETGYEPDQRRHPVAISRGFWLWQTEITRAEYRQLTPLPQYNASCPDCPVRFVSWHEAAHWANLLSHKQGREACFRCKELGKALQCQPQPQFRGTAYMRCKGWRLPTDAEWEYAYRAGTQSALYNGSIDKEDGPHANLHKIGWFKANSPGEEPHKVARKQPNAWGLYDMAGNVSEWVFDRQTPYPPTPNLLLDPTGATSGPKRVLRGGSCFDDAHWLRAAAFLAEPPSTRNRYIGFRLARTRPVEQKEPKPIAPKSHR